MEDISIVGLIMILGFVDLYELKEIYILTLKIVINGKLIDGIILKVFQKNMS